MMHRAVSFISRPSIFLPRYSGVRPIIRPQMNTAENGVHDHVHQAHALAAEHHIEHHVQQGNHAAQGSQSIVHVVDRAGSKRGGSGGEHGGLGNAEADFLALHAAHGLVQPQLGQGRVALALRPVADAQADEEDDAHGEEDGAALASRRASR